MFLRATKRRKDGKIHHYWSVVENVRVGKRVFQRRALYLGELNDSQQAQWQRAIEAVDEKGRVTQLKLFPEDRAPESDDGNIVRIRMDRLSVRNMRNWGEIWLGLQLWDMLELDGFWSKRLVQSRKGTNLKIIKMVDVVMPTSDGRVVTLPRYVEPKDDVSLLLNQLGFALPEQPPPKISECPDKR